MDCLNCDNEDNHSSTVEYREPNYSAKELKQMLSRKKAEAKKEQLKAKHNAKIQKKINALTKKLK